MKISNQINKLKQSLEQKRNSNNIFWKFSILIKDISWALSEFFKNKKNFKENDILISVFEEVYDKKFWDVLGGHGSGPGSLPEKTIEYRDFLQDFIKKNKIKSILDAGCGDWQFSKLIDWTGINYIGLDVVPFIIEENKIKHTKKNIKFYQKNFLECKMPKTDLVIIKDVLQHLTNENIINFLPKLKKFKFALLINDFGQENVDCPNGHFRTLNLKKPPFNIEGKEVLFFNNKQVLLIEN